MGKSIKMAKKTVLSEITFKENFSKRKFYVKKSISYMTAYE